MKRALTVLLFAISTVFAAPHDCSDPMECGEKIYQESCVYCHGEHGKHPEANLLVNPRDLSKTLLTEEQSYHIIKDGAHHWGAKADIMPSFKSVYTDEELRGVALYISEKFNKDLDDRIKELCKECEPAPKDQDAKMAKWGKKIWNRNCSFCHGVEGKGDGDATKAPNDSIYPYDLTKTLLTRKQIFLYVKYGGKHFGTDKTDMPSWQRKYNDFRLRSVARYVDEVIRENN